MFKYFEAGQKTNIRGQLTKNVILHSVMETTTLSQNGPY